MCHCGNTVMTYNRVFSELTVLNDKHHHCSRSSLLKTYHQVIFLEIHGSWAFIVVSIVFMKIHARHLLTGWWFLLPEVSKTIIYTWHSRVTAIVKKSVCCIVHYTQNHRITPWPPTSCAVPCFHPFLYEKHFFLHRTLWFLHGVFNFLQVMRTEPTFRQVSLLQFHLGVRTMWRCELSLVPSLRQTS